ncbi:penicillin-binding protein 2 [Lysinibacter sp. HNR]|uniref:peptidoglycan D,D-transpeptidase FtsI family protein n=1 Tax=Lysinibacter sp. HNR TaxID=3031408 RepID=UPI002434ADD0|nr:penicillin-binding protein 2 [Lysinibacter sp. HNR]WGD36474.1 penicillin-binding protein 2 [Lysinibacter sp. HNR]
MKRQRIGRLRSSLTLLVILSFIGVFIFRLADIQVVRADELNEASLDKRSVPLKLYGTRGNIVDEEGSILATTELRYDVQMSPRNVSDFVRVKNMGEGSSEREDVSSEQALAEIGALTGQSGEEIQKIVDEALAKDPKSDFAYVKRSVNLQTMEAVKDLQVPWLTYAPNASRTYPNGAVGGNVVGFVGRDNTPLAGIEVSQESCLVATDGMETYERGADGVALPGSAVVVQDKVDGGTVKLTLNTDLQWQVQQIVDRQKEVSGAEYAYATVMEAKTGKLRAVAEDGSVDPNNFAASDEDKRTSRAFLNSYEPGSTFKTLTAAALIDQGLANPGTRVMVPGERVTPNGANFRDSWPHGPTPYTLTGIMIDSSNVGLSMLAEQLSNQQRYDYFKKFGIGEPTNTGMGASESRGIMRDWTAWDNQTGYTTMFGQGLASTIIQTTSAYQAFANGGTRIPASVVESCTASDGTVTEFMSGDPVQVVKPESAKTMTDMLEMFSSESSLGSYVDIPGYRIAGKTGTAQQTDPNTGAYRDIYVYSFAGYFPAEDPQYVVVFTLGYPPNSVGARDSVTGFRDVAQAAIKTYAVPPSTVPAVPLPKRY